MCSSNFVAGDGTDVRNNRLDVKGVYGTVCCHMHPLKFVDLRHGER